MSLSKPFFNSRPGKSLSAPAYDKPILGEHWTATLDRRPQGQKYGRKWEGVEIEKDRDNYLDNFDTEDEREEIQ